MPAPELLIENPTPYIPNIEAPASLLAEQPQPASLMTILPYDMYAPLTQAFIQKADRLDLALSRRRAMVTYWEFYQSGDPQMTARRLNIPLEEVNKDIQVVTAEFTDPEMDTLESLIDTAEHNQTTQSAMHETIRIQQVRAELATVIAKETTPVTALSENKQQVMYYRTLGFTNPEVATILGLEIQTVKNYASSIVHKDPNQARQKGRFPKHPNRPLISQLIAEGLQIPEIAHRLDVTERLARKDQTVESISPLKLIENIENFTIKVALLKRGGITNKEIEKMLKKTHWQISSAVTQSIEKGILSPRNKIPFQHRDAQIQALVKKGLTNEQIATIFSIPLSRVSLSIRRSLQKGDLARRHATTEEIQTRDQEILQLVNLGYSYRRIAEELSTSQAEIARAKQRETASTPYS